MDRWWLRLTSEVRVFYDALYGATESVRTGETGAGVRAYTVQIERENSPEPTRTRDTKTANPRSDTYREHEQCGARTARLSMGQTNVEEQPSVAHPGVVAHLRIAQVGSVRAAVNGDDVEQAFLVPPMLPCRSPMKRYFAKNGRAVCKDALQQLCEFREIVGRIRPGEDVTTSP
ncbi:hypothetical protein BU15DRAFT_66770 [Melanogaster broomeanus]|nr:hypothetical protein BU15DRAFT_66770 [Melanogaster broomeanus]